MTAVMVDFLLELYVFYKKLAQVAVLTFCLVLRGGTATADTVVASLWCEPKKQKHASRFIGSDFS